MIKTACDNYKSYYGKGLSNGAPTGEPYELHIKVYKTKKSKAEISVRFAWFSESRGIGSTSANKIVVTDPDLYALCVAVAKPVLQDDAVLPLIDKMQELHPDHPVTRGAVRWWQLSRAEGSLSAWLDAERKENARANKAFAVGDRAVYVGNPRGGFYNHLQREVVITGERFEWGPYLGGGWRFVSEAGDAPQEYYRKVTN